MLQAVAAVFVAVRAFGSHSRMIFKSCVQVIKEQESCQNTRPHPSIRSYTHKVLVYVPLNQMQGSDRFSSQLYNTLGPVPLSIYLSIYLSLHLSFFLCLYIAFLSPKLLVSSAMPVTSVIGPLTPEIPDLRKCSRGETGRNKRRESALARKPTILHQLGT